MKQRSSDNHVKTDDCSLPNADGSQNPKAGCGEAKGALDDDTHPSPAPLLAVLALMNGSVLGALVLLTFGPNVLNGPLEVALLILWLLMNVLMAFFMRLVDTGRSGAANVHLPKIARLNVAIGNIEPTDDIARSACDDS